MRRPYSANRRKPKMTRSNHRAERADSRQMDFLVGTTASLMAERENFRYELKPRADCARSEDSSATNSAVILTVNGIVSSL